MPSRSLCSLLSVWHCGVAFSLLGYSSLAEEDCASLAAAGDCEFYRCLDRQLGGCGSEQYPLGFGYKYCRRFEDSKELFDCEGQQWIDRVRVCLMNEVMVSDNSSTTFLLSPSCKELATVAFDSHPHCYVEGGVCTHVVNNCDNFMRVIELLEFSDLISSVNVGFKIAAKQVLGVLVGCPWSIVSSSILCPLQKVTDSLLAFLGGIT